AGAWISETSWISERGWNSVKICPSAGPYRSSGGTFWTSNGTFWSSEGNNPSGSSGESAFSGTKMVSGGSDITRRRSGRRSHKLRLRTSARWLEEIVAPHHIKHLGRRLNSTRAAQISRRARVRDPRHRIQQRLHVDRFGEESIESRRARSPLVLLPPLAGPRN